MEACGDYLRELFDPYNIIDIRHLAEAISCTSLLKAVDDYILQYFYDVSQTDDFSSLTVTVLEKLISANELDVIAEEHVFESVIKWVRHDKENRLKHLPDLLNKVRLLFLDPMYLNHKIYNETLIVESSESR